MKLKRRSNINGKNYSIIPSVLLGKNVYYYYLIVKNITTGRFEMLSL